MPTKINFTTPIKIISKETLTYYNKFIFIGSCFSENIVEKMRHLGFNVSTNPQGILYNPISIADCASNILNHRVWHENDLDKSGEFYISWQHHGAFKSVSKQDALREMNAQMKKSIDLVGEKLVLVITLGSAKVYELCSNERVVGNCHKAPAKLFKSRLLKIEEIISHYKDLICQWRAKYPDVLFVFTVSPIRHVRDGLVENQLSKATLLLAINELKKEWDDIVEYFPAYEIMIDELRDYRFYDNDLIHPSSLSVEYIWQKFCDGYFGANTLAIMAEVEEYSSLAGHRILNPESIGAENHRAKLKDQYEKLTEKFPQLVIPKPE